MKFYNKYYENNYEELLTYYPKFYWEVYEMVEILKAHGGLADDLEDSIEQTYFNSFIDYADERTIEKLENFLGIGLNYSRTLEERRRLVKSFFVGFGRVSASMLEEMIRSYTQAPVSSRFEPSDEEGNNTLYIRIQRGDIPTLYMGDINLLLSKKIPAHINWQAAVTYRVETGVGMRRKYYKFGYDFAGTKPDTSTLGEIFNIQSVTEARRSNRKVDFLNPEADGRYTGVEPETAMLGQIVESDILTEATVKHHLSGFGQAEEDGGLAGERPDISMIGEIISREIATQARAESHIFGHEAAGTKPEENMLGAVVNRPTGAQAKRESHVIGYGMSGTTPETATLGDNNGIDTTAGVKVTSYGVDYIYCGEGFSQS